MEVGKFVNLLRAGLYFETCILKNNKGLFIALLARPYLVLAMLHFLHQQLGTATTLKDLVLLSLTVTGSIDVLWDIAGRGIILRMQGTLPYYAVVPEGVLTSLTVTFIPRYLLENFFKTLIFLPLLIILLEPAMALGYVASTYILIILGLLPLVGLSAFLAGLALLTKEESPWLEWITPLILLASGALFPVSVLPRWLRAISKLLPTTYIVEASNLLTRALKAKSVLGSMIIAIALLSIAYNAVFSKLAKRTEEKLLARGV